MIDKIVEMVSHIPQGIMIGFCVFVLVTVIVIIWFRTRSTLLFILEEMRRINISLNNIEKGVLWRICGSKFSIFHLTI